MFFFVNNNNNNNSDSVIPLLPSQNTGDFLIRANTKKRHKVQHSTVVELAEVLLIRLVDFVVCVCF